MEYQKLIDLYFEGQLDEQGRNILFAELAHNQELQEMFNQEIKLLALFKDDVSQISVPLEATNKVFSSLNFRIPNSSFVDYGSKLTYFWASLKTAAFKALPVLFSSIVASVATFLLLWNLLPIKEKVIYEPAQNITSSIVQNEQNVPKISSSPTVTNTITPKDLERIFERALNNFLAQNQMNSYYDLKDEEPANSSNLFTISSPKNNLASANFDLNTETNLSRNFNPFASNYSPNIYQSTQNTILGKLNGIAFSFRGFSMNSIPDVNIKTDGRAFFENTALGLSYEITENTSIGLEFGYERFAQKFTVTNGSEITHIKQNPERLWYGLTFSHSFPNVFSIESLKPYTQFFIGATTIGFLARGLFGFEYRPDRRVSLILGWEASDLVYKVQTNYYNTKKNGPSFGVKVRY